MDVLPNVMQSIRQEMRQGRGEHMTVAQFRLIAAIYHGLTSNKEIGNHLGISEAAVSRMVESFVRVGLIEKSFSLLDRRQKNLSLSLKGQKLFNYIKKSAMKSLENRLQLVSISDFEKMIVGLKLLEKNLNFIKNTK